MEPCREPVNVRVTRLTNFFLGRGGDGSILKKQFIGREGLLDALLVLYDECNNETLKKDKNISKFVEKFRSVVSELRRLRVNLADFEVKKVIGRGHFGEVQVVREKQTGDVYAMKILRKSDTLCQQGAAFYQEERDIMAQTNSLWLTSLQYAFQDMNNLYLVMEFHAGGDLLALLERFDGAISEDMACFYSAELAMAIHSLHNMGYVHRDIKPDNILIDRCGHLKLADFGSSARLTAAGVVTSQLPVGTPEYVAPEVLQALDQGSNGKENKQGYYGKECDYWSLGVVLYEMVIGRTPFSGEQLSATYHNIMSHQNSLQFPDDMKTSQKFQLLVSELLQDAALRLNHEKIIKHEFFSNVDWARLRDSVPPFVPVVASEDDTSNFVEFEHEEPPLSIENFKSRREFSGKDLPFIGFTFTPNSTQNQSLDSSMLNTSIKEKGSSPELLLAAKKKEIEDLYRKLQEVQLPQKLGEMSVLERKLEECTQRLQTVEEDRNQLELAFEKCRSEAQSLKRTLTLEREDRKILEANAISMIRDSKARWEKKRHEEQMELQKAIEEKEKEITSLVTEKEHLGSKVQLLERKWKASCQEIEQLQNYVEQNKSKMAEVREKSRMSIAGVESQLNIVVADKQKQIISLQEQLDAHMKHSRIIEDRLEEIEASSGIKVLELTSECDELRAENNQLRESIQQIIDKCSESHNKLEDQIKENIAEKTLITELKSKLSVEQTNNSVLHEQLKKLQKQISEIKETHERTSDLSVCLEDQQLLLSTVEYDLKESMKKQLDIQKNLQLKIEQCRNLEVENSSLEEKLSDAEKLISQLENEKLILTEQIASTHESSKAPVCCCHSNGISELTQQKVCLEAQVEKLESQLEKTRETLVLERESTKNIQSQLWKNEKELSDAKIDLRIAKREARTAEHELKMLHEEKQKLVEALTKEGSAHAEEIRTNWDKIEALHQEMKSLRCELERKQQNIFELNKKLEIEMASQTEGNRKLDETLLHLKSAQEEIVSGKRLTKSLETQVASLLSEVESLKRSVEQVSNEKDRLQKQLEEQGNKCYSFQMNINVLKETCSMLEEQLEEFEKVSSAYNEREKLKNVEIAKLQGDIENLQTDIRNARRASNEEKSLKILAETKLRQVEAEAQSQSEFIETLQAQLQDYKHLAETLSEQVSVLENTCGENDVSMKAIKRQLEAQQLENARLKEEMTQLLTNIHNLRESSFNLSRELEDVTDNNKELQNRLDYLQAELDEQRAYNHNREVKADATIQQQIKLIDFLQHNLTENTKKKKTLTGKLFGRQKENVAPRLVSNNGCRDIEVQLAQERIKVKSLLEQLEEARAQLLNTNKKMNHCECSKGKDVNLSPQNRRVLSHIVQSPGTQQQSNFERQPSLPRMHHNIPHRFELKLCMRVTKCAVCLDSIHFGRHAAVCQECSATAHPKCSLSMPTTCGLPPGFMRHFSRTWTRGENSNAHPKPASCTSVESFVKLPNKGNYGWEKRYLRLKGSVLEIFSNKPIDEEMPDFLFDLCPPDGSPRVLSAVPCSDIQGTASSDMPFILKVEIVPRTTCWPKNKSLLIMALNFCDKQKWVQALETVVQQSSSLSSGACSYSGESVIALDWSENQLRLDINCSVELTEEVLLLGAEEGLYSLKVKGRKGVSPPVEIHGPSHVHQIATISSLGLAILIIGEDRSLVQSDLHQLISAAEAAECAHPSITTRAIIPPSACPTCCHLFAVSCITNNNSDIILCVAMSDKLILLKWNVKETSFFPIKMLDTADPCSCIHFTAHSVIVGCNKFFEIDLQNFCVEEFLDSSDQTLAHTIVGTQQLNSFPVSILDITSVKSNGAPSTPEFLLCFNELGVFVDEYGRRTREEDIKWSHLPLAFVYRQPYIFIVHFMSIEIIKLTQSSFTREKNDSLSTVNYPDQVYIELNNPRYLGLSKMPGAIYASSTQPGGMQIVYLDAAVACKDDLSISGTDSDGADLNNCGALEFSFTSSLVQSLDGGLDSESTPSDNDVPFSGKQRVRFDKIAH